MGASEPNGGPALQKGIWVVVALAALIVILRVFAKLKIGQFRVDDILMILAMVCALYHFYTDHLSYSSPVSLSHIFLKYYVH